MLLPTMAPTPQLVAQNYRAAFQTRPNSQPFAANDVSYDPVDILDVSDQARDFAQEQRLLDLLAQIGTTGPRGRVKTLAEVGQDLQADLAAYDTLLGAVFRRLDVQTDEALVLKPDGKGHVLVENDHPDARTVDNLYGRNRTLVSRFMVIAARAALLNAAETDPGFRSAYEEDAIAAIEENVPLLKDRLLSFRLRVEKGALSTDFA